MKANVKVTSRVGTEIKVSVKTGGLVSFPRPIAYHGKTRYSYMRGQLYIYMHTEAALLMTETLR